MTLNWNECQSSGLPVDNTFPVLTSLFFDIRNSLHLQQPDLIRLVDSFGTLPALQSLTLHAPNTSGDMLLTAPWSQLTSLDLRVALKVVTAQQILLQVQCLQTLVITGVRVSDNVTAIFPVHVLTELRSIKFSTVHRNTTAAFSQPFSFPNLKSFELDAYEVPQFLLDIHVQSVFRLEELELSHVELSTDDTTSFLRFLPNLIHLTLAYCTCLNNLG
ncbi:hypothetical protein C8J57DRAFT_1258747 [Mycena rebaudengoi]|nr:hypothetical protein C8J57DRAFT_1258747 [Mycena rebaudengoi]